MADRKDVKVGMQVKQRSTKRIVKIKDFINEQMAVIEFEGTTFVCPVKDMDIFPKNEADLLSAYSSAVAKKKKLSAELEEAKSEYGTAEDELVEYLTRNEKNSTAAYDGLGRAEITGSDLYPRINEEDREAAFAAIKEMSRGEIIKETIHPATLKSFVSECIDKGVPLPKQVQYFFKPKLTLKKA